MEKETLQKALNDLSDILSSDSAFESDCVAIDVFNGKKVSDREQSLSRVIHNCYKIVHPLTSKCCKTK